MNSWTRRISIIATIAAIAVGATGCSTSKDSATLFDPEDLVPAFANAQTVEDELPAQLELQDDPNISPESTRLIGTNEFGRFWTMLETNGNICLIGLLLRNGDENYENAEISVLSCTSPSTLAAQGLPLEAGGADLESVSLLLIPADVDSASLKDALEEARAETGETILHFESPAQLITTSPKAARSLGGVEVDRPNGDRLRIPFI